MTTRTRTIEWSDPSVNLRNADGKSGLEFLRTMVDGSSPNAPIGKLLEIGFVEVREGYARCDGTPTEALCSALGWVHGGYASTLLDTVMGAAVMTMCDAKTAFTTSQIGVHFTRTITPRTGPMMAEGRVIHIGKRIATADATLKDREGTLYAHGTSTVMLFERPTAR
jgi:uncharacterized protein (TIGR00369 family)